MPGKVKVRVLAGRNLPVMDRSSDTTDAYVEVKLGSTTYKTDVCRKSLHPQWDSDWFRYEVDDSELQDEPLQIRLMDHDTYSANDAIGKVYIDLNPLLLPPSSVTASFTSSTANQHHLNPTNPESSLSNVQSAPGKSGGGTIMSGWIPVFDTMHGIRGEVHVIVKVELFSDFNKFRQSSCGVQFFCSGSIPEGHMVSRLQGLVGELVVEGDPEHQWIDKIRTPRASNEARQALFFKLSGELRRRIGLKAIELGANAVLGYQQSFDLEGETGIVVRGIGTAATLVKLQTPPQVQTQLHSPSPSPSPSPAGQVSSTTNQEPLEHSISSNSINHNSCPQATASPHSRRKNQFVFFPTSPSLSRHHISSSISHFAFSSGGSNPKVRSGSPKHLSVSGYGVIRHCPSVESLQKTSPYHQQGKEKDSNDEFACETEYKSKKKQGNNLERSGLVGRLKAVKFLPKSVHGRLSRLWSGGSANSNSLSHGSSYRRSVSDSAGIGDPGGGHFTKSDSIIDQEEFDSEPLLFVENSVKGDILMGKPSSYPGTTFPSISPVKINIHSPEETVETLIDESNDHNIGPFAQLPQLNAENTTLEEQCIIIPEKLNSDLCGKMPLNEAYCIYSSSDNVAIKTDDHEVNSLTEKFDDANLKNETFAEPMESMGMCKAVEDTCEDVNTQEKMAGTLPFIPKDEKSLAPNFQIALNLSNVILNEKPGNPVSKDSLLYSYGKDGRRKRTLSVQKSVEAYDSSHTPLLTFDDVRKNPITSTMKPAKSESFIAEMRKEPVILDFPRVPHRLERKVYDEDIIAQVCHLDEMINRRNMQSPRVRLHSRTSRDDEDFIIDSDLKPPTLEVSSWQEEEENGRKDSCLNLTYVDGHFYSNNSSSDEEDDSSSCISFLGDAKMDEDIIEYEQDSVTRNKCFLDTLAPARLVKGCRKKKLMSSKHSPTMEKDVSSNTKNVKTSGDKLLSHKNIIKDVQLKLLPIRNKKSIKDKTSISDDLESKEPRRLSTEFSCLVSQASLDSLDSSTEETSNQSTNIPNKPLDEKISHMVSKSIKKLAAVGKAEEVENRVSFNCASLNSLLSGVKDDKLLSQRESDLSINSVKTSKSAQGIESLTRCSRMHESCAGNSPLPLHASPSSSTSSTSTLQCLCRTPIPGNPVPEKQGSSPPSTGCQAKKNSGSTSDSHPCLHRRSSDSDLSVTPKGSSGGICGSSKDSVGYGSQWCHQSASYPAGGYPYHPYYTHGPHWGMHHLPHLHHPLMGRLPSGGTNSGIAPDPLDMAEYPFLTMTSYPPGFILHLAGTVSARSVKLLGSGGDSGGGGSGGEEEAWEQRDAWWTEVRMEIRSHARALACDVVVAYSEKTSICDDVCVLSASGTAAVINPNYFYHGIGPEDGLRGVGSGHQCTSGHRELMTSSLDRTDFERDKGVTLVASTTRTRNPSESRESGEDKAVIGSVGGMASSASPPQTNAPPPPPTTHHCSGAVHFPSCSVCHIPYGPSTVPFQISMAKCALCRRGCVPDVLLATCEPPEGLATIGVGSLIQAYASRGRRGEGGYGGGGSGGGGGMGGGGVVGVGVGSGGSSRGEASAKDISDGLPFLEYDLHRSLANKLRLCGMNAVFGLKVEVRVGEKLLVAIATGTGVLVSALPKPTVPCIRPQSSHQGGQVTGSQAALADTLQKNLEETVKRCREKFLLDPPKENAWANGTGRSGNSDTDDSGEDEHQHSLPQLDLSAGNKDTCVLEVDDDEDAEAIALLVAGPPLPPKGFHVAATERIPGLCYCLTPSATSTLSSSQSCQLPTCFTCLRPSPVTDPKAPLRVVRNLQMFSQVWRAKLSPPPAGSVLGSQYQSSGLPSNASGISQMSHLGQGNTSQPLSLGPPSTIALHFNRLLQGVFFKLRKMAPCALANLTFQVDLPEPEEVQLYVVGMALGLGERLPRRQRVHTSGGNSRDSTRKADDSEMIFSLEEEEEAGMKDNHPPPESSTPKPTSMPSAKGWIPFTKSGGPTWAHWPLLGERHGIEVTPLSYIPGGHIQQYLGNLNFFFIRESTCIRESGGLSGFVHSFMTEVLCIVRAHARALGGNALIAFSIVECVLLHNPHKNQGQSLINVSGDVVYASYEQE